MLFALLCGTGCRLGSILIPASDFSPFGHVPSVSRHTLRSAMMLGVDISDARWMSPVSRFIASVSASCADEMRASCWKNAVAFFDRMKAAIDTSTPAESATSTSTMVNARRRGFGGGAPIVNRPARRALMCTSDRRVVPAHRGDQVDEAVAAALVVDGQRRGAVELPARLVPVHAHLDADHPRVGREVGRRGEPRQPRLR